MIGTYGIARISADPVTDANVEFLEDTDLGIVVQTSNSKNVLPGTGATSLSASAAGNGYTIGKGRILTQNSTSGNGAGLKVMANIIEDDGIFVAGSTFEVTAKFDNRQNALLSQGSAFAIITATGLPEPNFTQPALVSTGGTGSAATFDVTISRGSVSRIIPNALGSGYRIGDVITISKAALDAGFGATITFDSDLNFKVSATNVLGGIDSSSPITIINSGKGYAAAEVVTLSEEGSSFTGTGTVTVGSISSADNTPGNTIIYPSAVVNTDSTAGAIQVVDMAGNTVVLGACQPGVIRKFAFKQVLGAGTGPAVGLVTVLY